MARLPAVTFDKQTRSFAHIHADKHSEIAPDGHVSFLSFHIRIP